LSIWPKYYFLEFGPKAQTELDVFPGFHLLVPTNILLAEDWTVPPEI